MDGILALVVVFWIVQAIVKGLSKSKERPAGSRHTADAQPAGAQANEARPTQAGHIRSEAQRRGKQHASQKARPENASLGEGVSMLRANAGSLRADPDRMKSALHSQYTTGGLSGASTESADPDRMKSALHTKYTGSMGGASTEGMDTCDPSLAHDRPPVSDLDSVYAEEIGRGPAFALDAKAVVQGVVMSEILTRPCDRKRGRR